MSCRGVAHNAPSLSRNTRWSNERHLAGRCNMRSRLPRRAAVPPPLFGPAASSGRAGSRHGATLLPQNSPQPPALARIHDKAGTQPRATAARMERPVFQWISVIERQLFTDGDIATCDDPDPAADLLGPAIRRAGVIDQPRHVVGRASVQIVAPVEIENGDARFATFALVRDATRLAALRLRFRDPFADVFDNTCAVSDGRFRVDAVSVNARCPRANRWRQLGVRPSRPRDSPGRSVLGRSGGSRGFVSARRVR